MLARDLFDRLTPSGPDDAARVKVRERLTVQKFDKTDVLTPGIDGLTPVETVVMEFENGTLVRTEVRNAPEPSVAGPVEEGGRELCR